MRKLLVLLMALPVVSFAANSKGGLFIEPGVTYQLSDTEVNWVSGFSNSTGENNGLGLSARLGLHISEAFFAGIDGRYGMTKFKDSAFDTDVDAKSWNVAPVVGIQMPNFGLRVWGAYVLVGEIDPDKITSGLGDYDAKASEANGYRIGAGFRIKAISLNLEYQDLKYGKASVKTSLGTPELNEVTEKGFIASVSFPMSL